MRAIEKQAVRPRRVPRQAGFSIIEVLVGFFILLLVLMGLLPLFTRAVVHNVSGKEATVVTNFGTAELENLYQVSFNNWEVGIGGGGLRQTIAYYARDAYGEPGSEEWAPDYDETSEIALWQRTTEVRQFGITGVVDTDGDGILDHVRGLEDTDYDGYFDNALPAGSDPNSIHLKEVRVILQSQRSPFGAGEPTELTLRSLKAF